MMRRFLLIGFVFLLVFSLLAESVLAQEPPEVVPMEDGAASEISKIIEAVTEEIEEMEVASLAVITTEPVHQVDKAAIFDASFSTLPDEYTEVVYQWSFGDGNSDQGTEVVHSYVESGEYEVGLDVWVDGALYAGTTTQVFVYEQFYLMITDQSDEQDKIESLAEFARDRGVFLEVISSFQSASEFIVEEDLVQKLNESVSEIQTAEQIIVWTRGSTGLTVLSRFNQSLTDSTVFSKKDFVIITDQNFSTIGNIARGTFRTIEPARMIMTRPEALWMLFESDDLDVFVSQLDARGLEYEIITEEEGINPLNFMSYLVNYMVEKGVPSNSLLLVLMLPVIVTIVAFLKQMIGLSTMGVYTPSIITLSFVALDIKFGLLIFVVIVAFGTLTRLFLQRYRLLYIPRMAIVLTIVSLTILVTLLVGALFDISQLVSISIFPMLIMSTMVEKFVSVQGARGFGSAFVMIGSTLFVSIICYYVVEWDFLKTMIFGHPELIFLFLIFDLFLGRWTGLRLLEYVRFREIFRYTEEEEE